MVKRVMTTGAIVLGLVLGGTASAHAGETNGKGEPIPGADMARSACAYSGQDLPDEIEGNLPGFDDDFLYGDRDEGRVQSYGQWVRNGFKSVVPSPGVACRGNVAFEE